MSLKKFADHLKISWRPSNTNDTDDSDCSSDSDSTQYIHNFLTRAKNNETSTTHKNWQYGAVGLPPTRSCEHPHPPFHPAKPAIPAIPGTIAVNVNSAAGSNYHLMHHDYAERMNEQLTRDTFNSDGGDLLNFGVHPDLSLNTGIPDSIGDTSPSNTVGAPEVGSYEMPVTTSLNLGKCPIKKRPWFMTADNCSKETGQSEGANSYDVPCSSRSSATDLPSPSLPQWSYRTSLAPPLLPDVMSPTAGPSSSMPPADVPSSSSQRDRLKLRLKRINLSEASSSSYTPYTCTLSHSMHGSNSNNMWPRARDKPLLFPSLSLSPPDSRVQPSTTVQSDPVIDDNSPEIQFISMEQPTSAQSVLMSRVSERMKRRKRRRMHLGMLGKTYVSDEVIVVDDGHQEQDSRPPSLPYKVSVPGPSSRRKLNTIPATSAKSDRCTLATDATPPHCSSASTSESSTTPEGILEQNDNATLDNDMETQVMRESSGSEVVNPERSATPDSVVAITPSGEVPVNDAAMLATDQVQDREARTPATGTSTSHVVPMQVVPTLLSTAPSSSGSVLSCRGPSDGEVVQVPQSLAARSHSPPHVPNMSGTTHSLILDASRATSSTSGEVKDFCAAGSVQSEDKQPEGKPTIRVRDMFKDESLVTDIVNRLKSKLMSLTAVLECPVCLEYVGPPIYQCRRGHIVCGLCKPKLMYCPTCRSGFSEYRNLIAEMFAERLDYPCKNAHLGCESTFTLKDKDDHEANCAFRFYKCILCPWKGLHGELLPHLVRDHPGKVGHGAEQEILLELGDMTASANQNWIVSAMNEIFRVNFILAKRQSNMQIMGSVQFIGPRRRADDFIYTFEVKSEEFDQHCIFSRKTHSDLDKCYTYYTNGDGFFINNSVLFSSGEEGNKCILVKLVLKKKISSNG